MTKSSTQITVVPTVDADYDIRTAYPRPGRPYRLRSEEAARAYSGSTVGQTRSPRLIDAMLANV